MIKITNGVDVFEVTEGAYEGTFKQQGYTPVVGRQDVAEAVQDVEEDVYDELDEKPVSQWTKAELKGYCDKHGISLTGATKTEDVRRRVLAFQEQRLAEE